VAYHAGLLRDWTSPGKNDEIGYATHVVTRGNLGVLLRIDLEHDSLAGHVCGRARDFRGGHAAGSAPIRPEIDEYGDLSIPNDLIEQCVIGCQGFSDGRQGHLTGSATARAGKILGRDAVFLSAIGADADDRHVGPPLRNYPNRNRSDLCSPKAFFILSTYLIYLMAIGFVGDPTARVMGKGGAQKKNSYTWSCAQSRARSLT
jgi:hypothetical protein